MPELRILRYSDLQLQKSPRFVGRLAHMGAKEIRTLYSLVLVAREEHIKPHLQADPPALVFIGGKNRLPGVDVILKPAVINADGNVHIFPLQLEISLAGSFKRIPDLKLP